MKFLFFTITISLLFLNSTVFAWEPGEKSPYHKTEYDAHIRKKNAEAIEKIYEIFGFGQPRENTPTQPILPSQPTGATPIVTSGPTPPFNLPPDQSFLALNELHKYVSAKLNIPLCVLNAVSKIESGSTWKLSPGEILQYSSPGQVNPKCALGTCSEKGHLQMTTGIDELGTTRCANCCWKDNAGVRKCRDACPSSTWNSFKDAIRSYENVTWNPNPCNLRDQAYAGAKKLKINSKTQANDVNWTQETIDIAVRSYHGNCTLIYPQFDRRTYCQQVQYLCSLK